MLLVHPPLVKPSEPPAGLAKISGALSAHNIPHQILDANIEALLFLLDLPANGKDAWTCRAIKNRSQNIAALRDIRTYQSPDRYKRAVHDVNRLLAVSGNGDATISLSDYQDQILSPIKSGDLLFAAEHPEQNIFYPYFNKRFSEIFASAEWHTVGFSVNYLSQALCAFAMIGFLKKEFPNLKIILGGGLISSWMKRPEWKNRFLGLIDECIAGPGEIPLLEMLKVVDESREKHYRPDYKKLPLEEYLSPGLILPYSASQGCYYRRCSFCPETAEGNPYTPVPVSAAMDHLSFFTARLKPTLVHLLDNALNPPLMNALIGNTLGVPWYGFTRITKELLDLDYCIRLKRSGCALLKIGLESGDQNVLDALQKGIDLAAAATVLQNLQKAGIATYVYLLFGTPPESIEEARRTLAFIVRYSEAINFLNVAIFNMPVSEVNDKLELESFYDADLSLYTSFKHPRRWDRKNIRQFLDKEFKRHPAIASILKNDPPYFTSNHAAFFVR